MENYAHIHNFSHNSVLIWMSMSGKFATHQHLQLKPLLILKKK